MSNGFTILIYAQCIAFTLILMAALLLNRRQVPMYRRMLYACGVLLGWQVCELLFFALRDPWWIRYVLDLKLAFVAFFPLAVFFMIASFYQLSLPRLLYPLLCLLPAVTAGLALTSPWHPLLCVEAAVTAWPPAATLTTAAFTRGWWYYVHMTVSFLVTALIGAVVLRHYIRVPRNRRAPDRYTLLLIAVYIPIAFVEMFPWYSFPLSFNLLFVSLLFTLLYFIISYGIRKDYLSMERRQIFDYLEQKVFTVDAAGLIVDANRSAREMAAQGGLVAVGRPYAEFAAEANMLGILRKVQMEDGTEDLYYLQNNYPVIHNIRRQEIVSAAGTREGMFVLLTDVTLNRLYIERLRETAGIDSLTGLPNRYRYKQLLRELDTRENLPLSIIIGDLNGLKAVNDTYGHEEGDRFICAVAEVLKKVCADHGEASRIGGDEFSILLPRTDASGAANMIAAIRKRMQEAKADYQMYLALGSATKTEFRQNLNSLVKEADFRMYDDKQWARKAGRTVT